MAEDTAHETASEFGADWPLRPWILAGLLGLAGLLVYFASDDGMAETVPWRMALTALVFFGPIAAAFALERGKPVAPAIFAGIVGLVMAGIAWRAASAGDHYSDETFWLGAGVLSVALALPLFQSGFHRRRFATPYRETHFHVWSDALSGAGALAFTGLSWALLFILDQLFQLVGIDVIHTLTREGWFGWVFSGAAFGAGLGTLRNQLKVLGTLQSVAMLVLSILALPLALGLIVFLVALIATGGQALWNATDDATPVLLACAIGAFVLGNAILRDSDEAMSGNRVLRYAALVLSLSILPLTVFAAISMGTRIAQHGLSPERLWGLIAIAVACAYGLAYLVAVIRGRKPAWRERLRRANLHLAAVICVIAFILALPIFDFGAISAKNQLARLEAGEVSGKDFDYAALRWDFGDAGRTALATLAKSGNATVAELAQTTLAEKERSYRYGEPDNNTRADFALRLQADDPALKQRLLDYLVANPYQCEESCAALDLGDAGDDARRIALVNGSSWTALRVPDDENAVVVQLGSAAQEMPRLKAGSTVEVREVPRRYIFIDGKPVGQPIDELEGTPAPR
jgi:hypothetical protein